MMAEPTIAPSEMAAILSACSGVLMPNPTAQGISGFVSRIMDVMREIASY